MVARLLALALVLVAHVATAGTSTAPPASPPAEGKLTAKTIAAGAQQLPACSPSSPTIAYYVIDAPSTGTCSQPGGAVGTSRALCGCDPTTSLYVSLGGGGGGGTTLTDSASLRSALSDETGTGAAVFATSPTLTTPNIGTATGSVTGNAGTATALAANGANCSAGQVPLGVNASGAAEGCAAVSAANVTSTATGGVAATNVQAAIDELEAEKAASADVAPLSTGTADPAGGTPPDCTVVGSIYRYTTPTPDTLWFCEDDSPDVWRMMGPQAAGDVAYAPTAAADWTAWGASTYSTITTALDSLAVGLRAAFTAATGSYDRVVDLTNGITWAGIVPTIGSAAGIGGYQTYAANPALQMQESINPFLDQSGTKRWRVKWVAGTADVTVNVASDCYDGSGTYPTGFCVGAMPVYSTPGAGGSGGFSGGSLAGWPIPDSTRGDTVVTGSATTKVDYASGGVLVNSAAPFGSAEAKKGMFLKVTAASDADCLGTYYITSSNSTSLWVSPTWSNPACTDQTAIQDYTIWAAPYGGGGDREALVIDAEVPSLVFDQTGVTKSYVGFMLGGAWYMGRSYGGSYGGSINSVNMNGYVNTKGTNLVSNADWRPGRDSVMDGTNLFESDRTFVHWMHAQNMRSHFALNRFVVCGGSYTDTNGVNYEARDDIGVVMVNTWGTMTSGHTRVMGCGTGVKLYGNVLGGMEQFYVANNAIGVTLGDGVNAGSLQPWSGCKTTICTPYVGLHVEAPHLKDWVVESAPWGLFLVYDALRLRVDNMFMESDTYADLRGHQLLYGARRCSNTELDVIGKPCGSNMDCSIRLDATTGGTCAAISGQSPKLEDIRFIGGNTPVVTATAATGFWWGGTMVGTGAVNTGNHIYHSTYQGSTTIPADAQWPSPVTNNADSYICTAAATPYFWCTGDNTNPAGAYVLHHSNLSGDATPTDKTIFDLTDSYFASEATADTFLPQWNSITSAKVKRHTWTVSGVTVPGTDTGTGACMSKLGTLVDCSSANGALIGAPLHPGDVGTQKNVWVKQVSCIPNWIGGSTQSVSARLVMGNNSTAYNYAGTGINFTAASYPSGSTRAWYPGLNTGRFTCTGGACQDFRATNSWLGVRLYSYAGGGTMDMSCTLEWIEMGGND